MVFTTRSNAQHNTRTRFLDGHFVLYYVDQTETSIFNLYNGRQNMNRITFELDENGNIGRICADSPVELYIIDPTKTNDRVYLYTSIYVGPQYVREQLGNSPIGHIDDNTNIIEGIVGDNKLPPSTGPKLQVVRNTLNESND